MNEPPLDVGWQGSEIGTDPGDEAGDLALERDQDCSQRDRDKRKHDAILRNALTLFTLVGYRRPHADVCGPPAQPIKGVSGRLAQLPRVRD